MDMRISHLFGMAIGAALVLAPPVALGQQDRGGVGGALDQLNRTINPQQDQDQRRARDQSGASRVDDRSAQNYGRYSDQELRDQSYRLEDEARRIERERRAVDDEMDRRRIRR
jgi:hypothetical protein